MGSGVGTPHLSHQTGERQNQKTEVRDQGSGIRRERGIDAVIFFLIPDPWLLTSDFWFVHQAWVLKGLRD